MGHKKYKNTALFLSSLMLSGAVFSAPGNKEEIATECKFLGTSLSQLAKANTKEYCSVDVGYSGILMEQSASLIQSNRIHFAIDNLALVGRTLERISYDYKDCAYFSSMILPYLDKTGRLIRQLESLNYVSLN